MQKKLFSQYGSLAKCYISKPYRKSHFFKNTVLVSKDYRFNKNKKKPRDNTINN